jgi:hypothetical protein
LPGTAQGGGGGGGEPEEVAELTVLLDSMDEVKDVTKEELLADSELEMADEVIELEDDSALELESVAEVRTDEAELESEAEDELDPDEDQELKLELLGPLELATGDETPRELVESFETDRLCDEVFAVVELLSHLLEKPPGKPPGCPADVKLSGAASSSSGEDELALP